MATEVSTATTMAAVEDETTSFVDSKTKSFGSPSSQRSSSGGVVDPKVCGVCGDKALGNNFNAITCESCKAFFRRNALRTKEFVCPFNNNCKVDAITRRFCQRCRLKKCFDIGMKKEWIMTEEEKKIKKQKIEQNRKKRSSLENSGGAGEASPGIDEDGNSEDAPPVAKKLHVSTESQLIQRLTTPTVVITTGGSTNGADSGGQSETGEDATYKVEAPNPPKIQKQPMGPHNQNQNSHEQNPSHVPPPRKGAKGRNNHVIAIQINTPSPTFETSNSPSTSPPSNYQHHSNMSGTDTSPYQHHYTENVRQPEKIPYLSKADESNAPPLNCWMEGDSSSSSLSPPTPNSQHVHSHQHQPPPLVKYPPNKRPRIYELHQDQSEDNSSNNQPTPLLSSLIQPSYPESSPDYTSSPPAPHLVQSTDHHSNSDDNEFSHQGISNPYHATGPSTESSSPHEPVRHHHIQHHQDYQSEFERSSPPSHSPSMISSYQNGYHAHYNSPSSYHSIDSDNNRHSYRESNMRMSSLNTMDSILSIAIAAEFNSFGMLGGNISNSKDLNKAEQAKLNELLLASQALHAPVDAERPIPKESDSADPSLLNVINLTEIAIRRLIKMSKKISGFKNMCQEDQIALLKGGCTEMMILRSAVTYDPDRDSWQIPHSNPGYNINLGVLKEARGNLYEEHQRFVKSFRSQWRKDENIMIILCAITLFTPERHNVIHRDVVKLEQDSYYYLLKRYLESILNGCEAKSNYLQLIRKIAELRALNSSHVRVFLEMNPKEVEPLLIEIFDLK